MILHSSYQEPPTAPQVVDRIMAARFTSGFCALAALSFFVAPITYFGVSEQPYGWNSWLIGGVILTLAFTRILWPSWSTLSSLINAALGVWVMISPWVFDYTDQLPLTVNCVGAGAAIVGLSLFSASFTRNLRSIRY